ncbi:inositol hexakisphosphate-domain-containing protein [Suillus fuscotomentosus]|uniref:Inositol hexakisphosphate-domain-containing protein n=1 Tax=Suillus fuscotomentosus TaxID=1912939 RepID=A0AAD4EF61_9AGAM|nr:inositol hexakisphosphate-domain-containing protein [Suillus fuscotomentosus]XP_041230685.1 inositol hexakisphosphate-domain-containing protein [Suillus fuscotomentosus]KAG1893242.1 inositol hexakisphosphate-domain-containing protein [Suillus fuscotomentosus]KAG1905110.1 inositol hexakisphosphate-domain-containing protein [Suillus fuscotomentosus]
MIDNQAPCFVPFEVSTMHINQLPKISLDDATERPASVPLVDRSALQLASRDVKALRTSRVASESAISMTEKQAVVPVDLMANLKRAEPSVVKTRTGSVLSRGFILKTDYYPSGRALDLDLNVHGAPNFRASRNTNVFGVAQPRTQGLRAILSILRCRPGTASPSHVVWFSTREEPIVYISGRPFVLRDSAEPRRTLSLSDRAENLEAIEERLKNDILQESTKYGGLILTHNELPAESGDGAVLPTWTHVDNVNVRTSRELWDEMRADGWNVEYHRIPISPDRPIEDNYLDAYLRVITNTDPVRSALVFSCGMGAVRTTFAMVAAVIVRRKMLLARGLEDPYPSRSSFLSNLGSGSYKTGNGSPGISTPTNQAATDIKLAQALENASAQQDQNKSLLRLTYVLQRHLHSQSVIALLMAQPTLLENLRKAHQGNYGVILSLLGCLDHGLQAKRLVDRVIDACDHVNNLREDILTYRVKYSLTTADSDESKREDLLSKARRALEKYFFMITFASYVDSVKDFEITFSDWLKARTEIWNQVMFLRKIYGSRLNIFAPVNDLSLLSRSGTEDKSLVAGQKNDVEIAGGQLLGDEYSDHVVKNRSGIILRDSTLLKSDQWLSESHRVSDSVRGAINFRNIPGTNIYASGQPTESAVDEVVHRVKVAHPDANKVVWVTLREEPIVYVNGAPYCLRRERFSLRNMKDYGGISASRLEVLEERLKDDVLAELEAFEGRLLLHTETSDGSVIPIWEEVQSSSVAVLKDIMVSRKSRYGLDLQYVRIPITSERPPDFADISELMDLVLRTDSSSTVMVVNCQLGRGRSTLTSVLIVLIQQWLNDSRALSQWSSRTEARSMSMSMTSDMFHDEPANKRHSYQVINNLLRIVRKGPAVKNTVDEVIDRCAIVMNLRDSIEDERDLAEKATDEKQKRIHASKGMHNLQRYFELILFQAYLRSTEPDTMQSFETFKSFIENRPVIKTFEKELIAEGLRALKPLERADVNESVARPDEVKQVVVNRSGSILSASTILKSDFFSNLQKMSLPERIEGSPNFRRVPLTLKLGSSRASSPVDPADEKMLCGSGMPTVQGLRRALARVDADPQGHSMVYWTSLREEPVIYIAGQPHVLRIVDKPLENVEATGVTTAMVEAMEERLKKDVIREVRMGDGRILLHDELEERPGVFSIIPIWETVEEADIMTPRDVFNLMAREGFKINYGRVAITDEQAPLPDALSQLLERVRSGYPEADDFIFNCQMGRGRTTTGMVTACLISTTMNWQGEENYIDGQEDPDSVEYDSIDGPSEEQAYRQGEYKTILQLVGVLSHGKIAKRLTDRAIDLMQDVQNLRKSIYDYKVKVEALEKGSVKQRKLMDVAVNYLYRYGTLIVFANYLIELREMQGRETRGFSDWLREHREIAKLLGRRSLD